AVVDGHSDAEAQGGLAVADRLASVRVVGVRGAAELGVEAVEACSASRTASRSISGGRGGNTGGGGGGGGGGGASLLGVGDGVPLDLGVAVVEHVGQAGMVVAVAGAEVAAEAVGDLVDRPATEPLAAPGGRGLQVRQQLAVIPESVALLSLAGVWRPGWGGV